MMAPIAPELNWRRECGWPDWVNHRHSGQAPKREGRLFLFVLVGDPRARRKCSLVIDATPVMGPCRLLVIFDRLYLLRPGQSSTAADSMAVVGRLAVCFLPPSCSICCLWWPPDTRLDPPPSVCRLGVPLPNRLLSTPPRRARGSQEGWSRASWWLFRRIMRTAGAEGESSHSRRHARSSGQWAFENQKGKREKGPQTLTASSAASALISLGTVQIHLLLLKHPPTSCAQRPQPFRLSHDPPPILAPHPPRVSSPSSCCCPTVINTFIVVVLAAGAGRPRPACNWISDPGAKGGKAGNAGKASLASLHWADSIQKGW
jgi:hypothetical protein